jgi:hypothetical protein
MRLRAFSRAVDELISAVDDDIGEVSALPRTLFDVRSGGCRGGTAVTRRRQYTARAEAYVVVWRPFRRTRERLRRLYFSDTLGANSRRTSRP